MSMVNVSLVGNLVKAPEQVCFASGRVKTTMVVAVNSQNKQSAEKGESADFYRIETWGKLAELAQKYLNKGNQVGVSGRLIMEHWIDRTGKERLTPVVAANQLSFPPRSKANKLNEEAEEIAQSSLEPVRDYSDSELLVGSRAVSVAEPRSHYRPKSRPATKRC